MAYYTNDSMTLGIKGKYEPGTQHHVFSVVWATAVVFNWFYFRT